MNEGLILWGAAVAGLFMSAGFFLFGVLAIFLTIVNVVPSIVGIIGGVLVFIGVAVSMLLYRWFIEGLEEEEEEEVQYV